MEKYTVSDKTLITLYSEGNEEAFEQLLTRHKSTIYTFIYLMVNDTPEAEELLLETFIRVVQEIKSGNYREEDQFVPWVLRIACQLSMNHLNKRFE